MDSTTKQRFIGIEIGGTKLQLVAGDAMANIKERVRYSIKAEAGAVSIREQIEEGIKTLLSRYDVQGIGVGFGGPVNWKTGQIQLSHQVEGWGNFNLKEWLESLTGIPVVIDNDANTAALAEAKHGCGKGYESVFYMTIGSGIGGGMIIKEEIYHGRTPGEVEIGHVRLDKNGMTLESKCSGWAVNQQVKEQIQRNPEGTLARLSANSNFPEAYYLKPALEENDLEALQIVAGIADDISFALSHVIHLFNPDMIVIGGGLSLLNEHLRLPIIERLPLYIMKALLPAPQVKIAALGEDVVPIGALELAKAAYETKKAKR